MLTSGVYAKRDRGRCLAAVAASHRVPQAVDTRQRETLLTPEYSARPCGGGSIAGTSTRPDRDHQRLRGDQGRQLLQRSTTCSCG